MAPGLLDQSRKAGIGLLDSHSIQDRVGTLALSPLFLQNTCSSSSFPLRVQFSMLESLLN